MNRILFIDDEQSLLDGLRRSLRSRRDDWEMVFVTEPGGAYQAARESSFDIVISEMRMHQTSGVEVLEHFRNEHPETARFVLSGQAELQNVMRAVPLAHQYLSKPCECTVLEGAVARALELKRLLGDGTCRHALGEIDSLPSLPDTYAEITRALTDPESGIDSIAEIIERDMAMSAKMLQLVNSAFFGLPRQVSEISQAASLLGIDMMRDLVLAVEVFRPPPNANAGVLAFLSTLQDRATWTGGIARRMFTDRTRATAAFTAGVLHDIGLVLSATLLPERLEQSIAWSKEHGRPLHEAEAELFGVGHAEMGAYLLALWGLPYPILEAAAYHHRPLDLPHEEFGDLAAVHVASSLVEARMPCALLAGIPPAEVAEGYLARIGVEDQYEEWVAIADAAPGGA